MKKKPLCFIDSSVFVEAILEQPRYVECIKFFHKASYKYKAATSTVVIGEVIKALNTLQTASVKDKAFFAFDNILQKAKISIIAISEECLGSLDAIKNADPYLPPSDRLIFGSAVSECCDIFLTLDRHFSARLGKEFGIKTSIPYEI